MMAKTEKSVDLRKKSVEDLHKLMIEKNRELLNLRFQKASGEMEKPHGLRLLRREIAKILTIIREKRV